MPPPSLLFGEEAGKPRVELRNDAWRPHQDITLPICYRNTPWALALAHALGFGIYREGGLVQLFDEPDLWSDIGYEIIDGAPAPGEHVVLRRGEHSYPPFFPKLLLANDAVQCLVFPDETSQARNVADAIYRNISSDELEPSDILVIFPDPLTVADRAAPLVKELWAKNVNAHIAGITSSRDQFFVEHSVAITGIFRAKGNEAPIVYVLDGQYCHRGSELLRKRNTLFTAITRSRAWVRVCGYGEAMLKLKSEIDAVVSHNYQLAFDVPTPEQLSTLRRIHRDMTPEDRKRLGKAKDSAQELLEQLEAGELSIEHLPEEVRRRLTRLFSHQGESRDAK